MLFNLYTSNQIYCLHGLVDICILICQSEKQLLKIIDVAQTQSATQLWGTIPAGRTVKYVMVYINNIVK